MHTYEHQKLETKPECLWTKWVDYWVFIKWNTHNENEQPLHATTSGKNVEQKKPVDIERFHLYKTQKPVGGDAWGGTALCSSCSISWLRWGTQGVHVVYIHQAIPYDLCTFLCIMLNLYLKVYLKKNQNNLKEKSLLSAVKTKKAYTNIESVCCIPKTNILLYIYYTSIKYTVVCQLYLIKINIEIFLKANSLSLASPFFYGRFPHKWIFLIPLQAPDFICASQHTTGSFLCVECSTYLLHLLQKYFLKMLSFCVPKGRLNSSQFCHWDFPKTTSSKRKKKKKTMFLDCAVPIKVSVSEQVNPLAPTISPLPALSGGHQRYLWLLWL